MSTRCNIIVKGRFGKPITIYHHHDGYPEGVGSILKEYCTKLNEKYLYMESDDIANRLVKKGFTLVNEKNYADTYKDDEYEIASALAGDIDYLYVLRAFPYAKNGNRYSIKCYHIDYDTCIDITNFKWLKRCREVEIPYSENDTYHIMGELY